MTMSEHYRNIFAEEIRIVRTKMEQVTDPKKKVYYYSAIYGMARRINNFDFDPHTQLVEFVINGTYGQILNRINSIASGDNTIPISENFFDRLCNCLRLLEDRIRNNEDDCDILEKIVCLAITIDGNGYYLVQKGVQVYID